MSFVTFEEIQAWQEARRLTQHIRKICRKNVCKKDYGWIDQISRAALSIMANIAEGNDGQTNLVFMQFLSYAKRSATEVRSHLYYALDESYITQEEFHDLKQQAEKVAKQLGKLILYLRKHDSHRVTRKPVTSS